MAIDVSRAVQYDITIPILELLIDSVEVVIAEADPKKISVITNIFFFFLWIYISSYNNHYQFEEIIKHFHDRVPPLYILFL